MRRGLWVLAAAFAVGSSLPPVQGAVAERAAVHRRVAASPQPGASCMKVGSERSSSAGKMRCVRGRSGQARWRLVAEAAPTATPTTTSSSTTSTSVSVAVPPTVTGAVADQVSLRFSLSGMSPDTGVYSVQWVERGSSFNTYQMVRATSRDVAISSQTFRCDRTYTFRVFVMRTGWTLADGHSMQNVTPHSEPFNVTMTHACTGSSTAAGTTTTTAAPLTCATGGTCIVGDTGPGGGIVFYVHPSGTFACGRALQSTCKYLEAAPTSGASAWTVTTYAWSGNTGSAIGANARLTAVGEGFSNTLAIVRQASGGSTASRAATSSRAYRGPGSLFDWYLPSSGELQEMFSRKATLGIATGSYWSSTEAAATDATSADFASATWSSASMTKSTSTTVRPIRAFGGTLGCADGGTCVVGDIGPGGGPVFYVAASAFTSTGSDCGASCRYLEASLTNDEAFSRNWATGANQTVLVTGADGTTIGSGYQNTVDIVNQAGNVAASSAAAYAYDYSSDFNTDWHLPSRAELNEMCKYAVSLTPGNLAVLCAGGTIRSGFASSIFMSTWWSSTEASATNAEQQYFVNGSRSSAGKNASYAARPVRAFNSTS